MVLVLGACDDGNGAPVQPTSPVPSRSRAVIEAAQETAATGSVALDMTVEFGGSSQVPDGTTIGMSGRSTLGDPRTAELHADFEALGVGSIDMLIDDQDVYIRGGVIDRLLRSAKGDPDWLFVDLTSSHPAVAQFGGLASGQNDAALLLYFLFGATGDVRDLGGETIDGVATTHYSLTTDLEAALADAPEDVRAALHRNVSQLETQGVETRLGTDVWVDGEQLIRRIAYVYRLSEQGGGGEMLTTVSFSGFGEPVELDVPGAAEIVDVTEVRSTAAE